MVFKLQPLRAKYTSSRRARSLSECRPEQRLYPLKMSRRLKRLAPFQLPLEQWCVSLELFFRMGLLREEARLSLVGKSLQSTKPRVPSIATFGSSIAIGEQRVRFTLPHDSSVARVKLLRTSGDGSLGAAGTFVIGLQSAR